MANARNKVLGWKIKKKFRDFYEETESKIAEKILKDFTDELMNFKQVCPIEMLDKLDQPISNKPINKSA